MNEHAEHDLRELRRRIGDVSQLVSTKAARLSDGSEDGVRVIDARAAGGLSAMILADRGLDLGAVWAAGHQVGWQSTTGAVHPAYFSEPTWLRSFHGGPADDLRPAERGPAVHRPGHRRTACTGVSPTSPPATSTTGSSSRTADWWPRSAVRCARRTSSAATSCCGDASRCPWASGSCTSRTRSSTRASRPAAVLILYHVNLGYPVVADGARLIGPPAEVVGRDERAQGAIGDHASFPPPEDGFAEYVYEHRLRDRDAPSAPASRWPTRPSRPPAASR